MSFNQNNSVLLKNVQHNNRFLNANLAHINSSTMFNVQNNARKLSKSISISNSINPASINSNSSLNSYQCHYSNNNYTPAYQHSSSFNNSMIKNHSTPTFALNRKYSTDYEQAVRFDYNDAFVNNNNMEFMNRVSQMQRLQIDTVEWERKKKQSKKKITKANSINGNPNNID